MSDKTPQDRQGELGMQTPVVPSGKMFYKIREVAKLADVKPHVLRYWESEFPTLKPQKNKNGQRIYTSKEIDLILQIKQMLHVEKYSIAGARQNIRKKKSTAQPAPVEIKAELAMTATDSKTIEILRTVRDDLANLSKELRETP